MRNPIARLLASGVLLSALFVSSQAQATAFTVSAAVNFNGPNGAIGTVNPVNDVSGAFGLTDGTVSFGSQDVFVVDITLSVLSDPVDAVGISVGSPLFFVNPVGAGSFADGGSLVAPTAVLADNSVQLLGLFTFGTAVQAGETTVRLFTTHSPAGDIAAGQTVNFMISSGTDFTAQGTTAEVTVPEAGVLALLAVVGLGGLAVRRRRA